MTYPSLWHDEEGAVHTSLVAEGKDRQQVRSGEDHGPLVLLVVGLSPEQLGAISHDVQQLRLNPRCVVGILSHSSSLILRSRLNIWELVIKVNIQ